MLSPYGGRLLENGPKDTRNSETPGRSSQFCFLWLEMPRIRAIPRKLTLNDRRPAKPAQSPCQCFNRRVAGNINRPDCSSPSFSPSNAANAVRKREQKAVRHASRRAKRAANHIACAASHRNSAEYGETEYFDRQVPPDIRRHRRRTSMRCLATVASPWHRMQAFISDFAAISQTECLCFRKRL
jgi:hypothetical protein